MQWIGNLRKMNTELKANSAGKVQYQLSGADIVEPLDAVDLNDLVGRNTVIEFQHEIHCRATGKRINKTFGEGLSYNAWIDDPSSVPSVLRPELSRIHEGVALRDHAWEQKHHNQPHLVYISQTGNFKVGVTRSTNRPFRWHDQGAVGAIAIAEVPYRQLAGEMEVALKDVIGDRTNYRKMLTDVRVDMDDLLDWREVCFDHLGERYEPFFLDESKEEVFDYPVILYPEKIKSVTLDKQATISGMLSGIKGQYLIFDNGSVFNVRRHSGYRVRISTMD